MRSDPTPSTRKSLSRLALLGLLSFAASRSGTSLASDPEPLRVLRIEQTTSGIPDARPGRPTRRQDQVLMISTGGDRLRLDELAPGAQEGGARRVRSRSILRLDRDPAVVWKLAADGSSYEEFHGDLDKTQRDRDVYESQLLEYVKLLPRAEREKVIARHHLLPDGSRQVRVTRGEMRTILGHACRRLLVNENGRAIIDAWVTEEVGGGRSFFGMYRRLGAFSSEVLREIEDIPGVPLRASITVVTKLPAYTLEVEVTKVEERDVPAAVFDLPPGARKLEKEPTATRCPWCGKEVETNKSYRVRLPSGLAHFCDADHARAYLKKKFPLPGKTPSASRP